MNKRNAAKKKKKLISVCRGVTVFSVLLFSTFTISAFPAKQQQYPEYKVKASILDGLAECFTWPKESGMNNPAAPFVIAVIGKNPFGIYLDEAYSPKNRIKNKPVQIRYIHEVEEIPGCHLLFLGDLNRKKLLTIIEFTAAKPILTVADIQEYKNKGLHVNLYLGEKEEIVNGKKNKKTRIMMDIDQTAIRQAGLSVDKSRLNNDNVKFINPYIP